MFRPNWPSSGVYWVRLLLLLQCGYSLRRPQVSYVGGSLFICNVWWRYIRFIDIVVLLVKYICLLTVLYVAFLCVPAES
jgi:hypothetical protein